MELGFSTMNTDLGIEPHRLAAALEERGFGSFWVGEHSHIPVGTEPPYGRRGPLEESYRRMRDPLVSLAAAAVTTSRIVLGTCVLLAVERDPFFLAKELATIDHLCKGRLVVAVGAGWNRGEYEHHTTVPWSQRYRLLRDRIAAVRALWAPGESAYEGEFTKFGRVWSYPKPRQQPGPPVLVGGLGPTTLSHVVEWADGWAPLVGSFAEFLEGHRRLVRAAEEAGRDPDLLKIVVSLRNQPKLDELAEFKEFGIGQLRLGGNPAMPDDEASVLRQLDEYASFIPQVR